MREVPSRIPRPMAQLLFLRNDSVLRGSAMIIYSLQVTWESVFALGELSENSNELRPFRYT